MLLPVLIKANNSFNQEEINQDIFKEQAYDAGDSA
jgi:hypothetical protein